MTKTLILQIKYGGLGDHLFYSHIPRIAKETGAYDKVLISNKSEFRSQDYKDIVWGLNPHIDGFTDKVGVSTSSAAYSGYNKNLLDHIMLDLGLDDGERFHEPEIYYVPRVLEELKDAVLYDPNYLSNAGFVDSHKVCDYFATHSIFVEYQLELRGDRSIPVQNFKSFIRAKTIYDFMDILASVKSIYCLVTGTATLASALRKKASVFYTGEMDPTHRHSRTNSYIEI